MSPFKRLKLKAMLRNCDYILAGTVIKQQYYDANKNTEVNRLIDQFMANPGFDEALKLIAYNDFMVFYFTESCTDGLYVRKTSQEPPKAAATPTNNASSRTVEDFDHAGGLGDGPSAPHNLKMLKNEQEVAAAADAELTQTDTVEEPQELSEKARHLKQIIQESEEWMEQVIANRQLKKTDSLSSGKGKLSPIVKKQQQPADTATKKSATVQAAAADIVNAKMAQEVLEDVNIVELRYRELEKAIANQESTAADGKIQESMINAMTDEINRMERENAAAANLKREQQESSNAMEPKQDALDDRSKQVQPTPAPELLQAQVAASEPAAPPSRVNRILQHSFPNVAATLKIDIHTMSKQLDDYRRQLSFSPANKEQLKAWIQSLEEAIQEFSLALDLLEGED